MSWSEEQSPGLSALLYVLLSLLLPHHNLSTLGTRYGDQVIMLTPYILHLHLSHLADSFTQSDLQLVSAFILRGGINISQS